MAQTTTVYSCLLSLGLLLSAIVPGSDAVAGALTAITASQVAAAASSITAGSSLVGTSLNALMAPNYYVTCGIEVENWTKYPLSYPNVQLGSGALTTPPRSILPAKREAMATRKTANTATGTAGTVSWLIEASAYAGDGNELQDRRFIVMWSAPFDFTYYSNWLGLGLTNPGQTHHQGGSAWFDLMYYDDTSSVAHVFQYDRKEFWDSITPVLYEDDRFLVTGTMGSAHRAEVKISVRPKYVEDLATSIQALLSK